MMPNSKEDHRIFTDFDKVLYDNKNSSKVDAKLKQRFTVQNSNSLQMGEIYPKVSKTCLTSHPDDKYEGGSNLNSGTGQITVEAGRNLDLQ